MKTTTTYQREITDRFRKLQTTEELAELLSWIYNNKYPHRNPEKPVVIEAKHLNYYAFAAKNTYTTFSIPKKSGGLRSIATPRYKLKTIQRCLNDLFNILYTPHPAAFGFTRSKNIVDNAYKHTGKQYVYNIDLKDFFPGISFRRIKSVLALPPFFLKDTGTTPEHDAKKTGREHLGFLIANLCCHEGHLPQGAPTSPTLTNVVCGNLDRKLLKFARNQRAVYTRYADDITFSSHRDIFNGDFLQNLRSIIETQEKMIINERKIRLQTNKQRQSVTGIIVNRKTNLNRSYIKDIRFWLMYWKKQGTENAQKKFTLHFPEKKGFSRYNGNTPDFRHYLQGKIQFLAMAKGKEDSMVTRFLLQFNALQDISLQTSGYQHQSAAKLYEILFTWEKHGLNETIAKYPL